MQIININSFPGKNIYSHRPVIRMEIDIGELYDTPTKDILDFNKKLLDIFPGLKKHYCSIGYEGGFADRLEQGTYLPHVIEHSILELQNLMGYEVTYGKARVYREPSLYYLIFEYVNELSAVECAKTVIELISKIIEGIEIDINSHLSHIKKISVESDTGPSTKAIYDEAKRRGIPVVRLGNESLLQLGYGKYKRLIEASLTDQPCCINVDIAGNKHLTKKILSENMVPVPEGSVIYTAQSAIRAGEEIGYPVVIKPLDSNQGKGVTLNINSREQILAACEEAFKHSKAIIVEKYVVGKDYRILVIGDKVSAVAERKPPFVTGDGIHSIKELVYIVNECELRGDDHEKPLTKIKLDNVAIEVLRRMGFDENYIPCLGEEIRLRDNGNISTGGTASNCTKKIHPYNNMISVRAAKAIGLDIAGVDITTEDISIPANQTGGAVIEVNAAPGLRMHLHPTYGESVNVAADILDMMYPEGQPYTIPIVSITGTNGKTTTTRLIRHAFTLTGKKVGMTSTSGIYIGNECVLKGDNTGPISARMVLSNKEVEVAVLETARGGIVRKGLGYEAADVSVVVNISEDHLGLDGINTIEELAFVKALVVEAVKPEGYAVLNAEDKMTPYLMGRTKCKIMMFSRNSSNEILEAHIDNGGKAVFIEDNNIVIWNGKTLLPVMGVQEIPITMGGIIDCNIENSLAAVSAMHALNMSVEKIRKALISFMPDVTQNPGRFNIFDMNDFKVMLDYSHNIAGYNAVISFAKKMKCTRLIGVIGMPGDRLDSNIKEVGTMCGRAFSKLYIKEDNDLRGRNAGEVADILYESAIKSGISNEKIEIIYSETKALELAMKNAEEGDLIIIFYEDFDSVYELIKEYKTELDSRMENEKLLIQDTAG